RGALAGLRVVDCSRLIAGGVLATILADHGADVVKVENPRGGDPLRTWLKERGELWWKVYARGKRSITLNLAHPRGQTLLTRLVRDADVLVENFVPGTLEKWGLRHRDHVSGRGQVIDLSLYEPLLSLLGPIAAEYALDGTIRTRHGNQSDNASPRGTYRTRDGKWIALSASTPASARALFDGLG